jgi:hypothetical protein
LHVTRADPAAAHLNPPSTHPQPPQPPQREAFQVLIPCLPKYNFKIECGGGGGGSGGGGGGGGAAAAAACLPLLSSDAFKSIHFKNRKPYPTPEKLSLNLSQLGENVLEMYKFYGCNIT